MPDPSPTPTPTVTPSSTPYYYYYVSPSPTPSATTPAPTPTAVYTELSALQLAFPEIAESLTLNPAESALMLNPEIRALETIYTQRARQGEFGYEVHRRLRHLGYNI